MAGKLTGIVMHWTVSRAVASKVDLRHYHFCVNKDGTVARGAFDPEDNISCADGSYAPHTGSANTGRIGVAMVGMFGATERPFNPGPYPITWTQVNAMVDLVADLCHRYSIPVKRETVLTHAEVEPTLGIKQKGKWDITWLPGMLAPGNPIEIGDRLRGDIIKSMKERNIS